MSHGRFIFCDSTAVYRTFTERRSLVHNHKKQRREEEKYHIKERINLLNRELNVQLKDGKLQYD